MNAGKPQPKPEVKKIYRVRKSKDDARSQTGAYAVLDNVKKACPREYEVYDEQGNTVFSNVLKYGKGEKVYLAGAKLYIMFNKKKKFAYDQLCKELGEDYEIIYSC